MLRHLKLLSTIWGRIRLKHASTVVVGHWERKVVYTPCYIGYWGTNLYSEVIRSTNL